MATGGRSPGTGDTNLLGTSRDRAAGGGLIGGWHKEGRSRGTGRDPASPKHRKGEGRIAADVVLNLGI